MIDWNLQLKVQTNLNFESPYRFQTLLHANQQNKLNLCRMYLLAIE